MHLDVKRWLKDKINRLYNDKYKIELREGYAFIIFEGGDHGRPNVYVRYYPHQDQATIHISNTDYTQVIQESAGLRDPDHKAFSKLIRDASIGAYQKMIDRS